MRFGLSRCENGHRRCFGPPNLEFLNTSRFHVGTLQEFKLNLQLQLRLEKVESCFQEKMPQLHVVDFLLELHQRSDFLKRSLILGFGIPHHFSPPFGRIPGILNKQANPRICVSSHPPLELSSLLFGNFHQIPSNTGWWFRIFFIFNPTWGNDPI